MTTVFVDQLERSIQSSKSVLVAGCDPVIEKLPAFLLEEADSAAKTSEEFVSRVLDSFSDLFVAAVRGRVAASKPNAAFFEQYGVAGLVSFRRLCKQLKAAEIPVIIDAKRGDIGSTAAAYSAAFLGRTIVKGREISAFEGDALTVNPFLGFDTLEPFLADCERYGKGIFVLVQTSNPGAKAVQGLQSGGRTVSEHVAHYLAEQAHRLQGSSGWSGLGAVVGASYPEEAKNLRGILATNYFLIPGLGAQGAGAADSVAGFGERNGKRGGGLVNVSRGLLDGKAANASEFEALMVANADAFNAQLSAALQG
jgi:orotidine-5'-phosphate decarboxylase